MIRPQSRIFAPPRARNREPPVTAAQARALWEWNDIAQDRSTAAAARISPGGEPIALREALIAHEDLDDVVAEADRRTVLRSPLSIRPGATITTPGPIAEPAMNATLSTHRDLVISATMALNADSRHSDIARDVGPVADSAEMTLREIGRHFGLSRERIRQLQEQALAKLRAEFGRRRLL